MVKFLSLNARFKRFEFRICRISFRELAFTLHTSLKLNTEIIPNGRKKTNANIAAL